MSYSLRVRWDRFFDDLEDQLASEWEAERAALDTEAERLRLSRVTLRERLEALAAGPSVSFELGDGSVFTASVAGVGADWTALTSDGGRAGMLLVPLARIVAVAVPHAELLRSARASASTRSVLADRMTLGYVLRDLVRRRVAVAVQLVGGRQLAGTIDRAGADHLDLALHDPGAPRRAAEVTGHRLVPFAAIAWVRVEGDIVVP